MTGRKGAAGEGGLALALLVMAGGLGLLAAAVISLLPYLIVAGSMLFAARRVNVEVAPLAPARVRAVLGGWMRGLGTAVIKERGGRWQRPPMEGSLT